MGRNTSVTGATLAGAAGLVLVYVLELITKGDIPPTVEGAITLIILAVGSYFIPATPQRP